MSGKRFGKYANLNQVDCICIWEDIVLPIVYHFQFLLPLRVEIGAAFCAAMPMQIA